jgi:hypothetical protein
MRDRQAASPLVDMIFSTFFTSIFIVFLLF